MSKKLNTKKRKAFMRDSDDESHQSQFETVKPPKKPVEYLGNKNGRWDETEKTKYFLFIDGHKRILSSDKFRRMDKIYTAMAKFIETRSNHQCKAHHYKMIKKYGSFESIIQALKQDQSTKISIDFNPKFQLDEFELFSQYCELNQVFPSNNKEYVEQSECRSSVKMEESIKFADMSMSDMDGNIFSYAELPLFNNNLQLSLRLSETSGPTA